MLSLSRVVVPLTLSCNLKCKYCYRKEGNTQKIPSFSEEMIKYLNNLSPSSCSAVVASGGEPLLVWDKVKELFSYVPFLVHKKIMTNGIELTQEIVDYCNSNHIELVMSHDGDKTDYLRGYDILKDPELVSLINSLDSISFHSVCTNINPNPYLNFLNTSRYFNRDINYTTSLIFEESFTPEFIKDFNFNEYCRGYLKLLIEKKIKSNSPNIKKTFNEGFNVLPDGSIVSMTKIDHVYGTINSSLDELKKAKDTYNDYLRCSNNSSCSIRDVCNCSSQVVGKNYCEGVKQITLMCNSLT